MKAYVFNDPLTDRELSVGELCKRWRITNNFALSEVAEELDYSVDNIVKFEQGKNNNMMILLWYLLHGFNLNKISIYAKVGEEN